MIYNKEIEKINLDDIAFTPIHVSNKTINKLNLTDDNLEYQYQIFKESFQESFQKFKESFQESFQKFEEQIIKLISFKTLKDDSSTDEGDSSTDEGDLSTDEDLPDLI